MVSFKAHIGGYTVVHGIARHKKAREDHSLIAVSGFMVRKESQNEHHLTDMAVCSVEQIYRPQNPYTIIIRYNAIIR